MFTVGIMANSTRVAAAALTEEYLVPNTIIELTDGSGSVSDINEGMLNLDSNWIIADSNTSDMILHVGFETPVSDIRLDHDFPNENYFKIQARKNGGTGTPSINAILYLNGVLTWDMGSIDITGEAVKTFYRFNRDFSPSTGDDVELKIIVNAAGGGPNARCSVDIGAIEWFTRL